MEEKEKVKDSVFATLNAINVNEHTEKKKTGGSTELTYLSWPWSWAEVKKRYPDASYTVYKDERNRPYIEDPDFGLMCYTTVTINGQTHEMWLPVMNGANKAMKRTAYTYRVWNGYSKKYEEKIVEAASMFDINKTIMRCLVKNLAMFGLGLYIYAGEDLPETEDAVADGVSAQNAKKVKTSSAKPVPQEPFENVKRDIMSATTTEALRAIFNKYTYYQQNADFVSLLTERKNLILNGHGITAA